MKLRTHTLCRAAAICLLAVAASSVVAQPTPPVPAGQAPGGTFDPSKPVTAEVDTSLYARAKADPRLIKFISLVEVTRMESLLRSENATLLAPTDAAFEKVPREEIERLLTPEANDELRALVRSHVLMKLTPTQQFGAERRVRTYGNRRLLVEVDAARKFTFAGASIVQADVTGSNGVMHLIDKVLLPPPNTVLQTIENDPTLTTFAKLVKASGREEMLTSSKQVVTVFAPSDEVFARLSPSVVEGLLNPDNLEDLKKVIGRHIVSGSMFVENLEAFASGERGLPTFSGEPLKIEVEGGGALINKTARISKGDTECKNGVLHITNDLLRFIPWGDEAKPVPAQPIPTEKKPDAAPAPTPQPK
ncbi:MAG: fasciclin domain-containing protein [Phycisphaerales bacterium]